MSQPGRWEGDYATCERSPTGGEPTSTTFRPAIRGEQDPDLKLAATEPPSPVSAPLVTSLAGKITCPVYDDRHSQRPAGATIA